MRSEDARSLRAALFAAGLAACALSGGACSAGTTADTPPLPAVAFEEWVKPPFMTVSGCAWAAPRPGHEPVVECSLVLTRDMEMHGLWWIAYSSDGREIARGGSAMKPWTIGEHRRVKLALHQTPKEPVARIGVEPF